MCSFYLHRPVKAHICRKNKKTSFLLQTERACIGGGEKTFLDSKDRVCFLLELSIVPGAAAAVLSGEPPPAGSSQSEGRIGRPWGQGRSSLATVPPHKKNGKSGKKRRSGQMYSLSGPKKAYRHLQGLCCHLEEGLGTYFQKNIYLISPNIKAQPA